MWFIRDDIARGQKVKHETISRRRNEKRRQGKWCETCVRDVERCNLRHEMRKPRRTSWRSWHRKQHDNHDVWHKRPDAAVLGLPVVDVLVTKFSKCLIGKSDWIRGTRFLSNWHRNHQELVRNKNLGFKVICESWRFSQWAVYCFCRKRL